jgi:hypothetical protein
MICFFIFGGKKLTIHEPKTSSHHVIYLVLMGFLGYVY